MDVTPLVPADRQVISGYGPGLFRVSGIAYEGAVLVFPDHTLDWGVTAFDAVEIDSFRPVIEAVPRVEILLIGSGPRMVLLAPPLRRALRTAGVVADVMDSGAACRTYNVLLAEGRRVAAALLPL